MSLPKWLQILAEVGPKVLMFTPLAPITGVVVAAIGEAQAMEGASGAVKLAHVVNIATDAATATNLQAGHVVIDPAVLQATAVQAINTAVSVTKMVHDAHAEVAATVTVTPETPAAVQPTSGDTV